MQRARFKWLRAPKLCGSLSMSVSKLRYRRVSNMACAREIRHVSVDFQTRTRRSANDNSVENDDIVSVTEYSVIRGIRRKIRLGRNEEISAGCFGWMFRRVFPIAITEHHQTLHQYYNSSLNNATVLWFIIIINYDIMLLEIVEIT